MIHSLFAGQVSPWHSFILKESKRFFGVLSWADSHRGAILVLVIKKLPGFFFILRYWGHLNSIMLFCREDTTYHYESLQFSL